MRTASEARELGAYRDCSNRLLDGPCRDGASYRVKEEDNAASSESNMGSALSITRP